MAPIANINIWTVVFIEVFDVANLVFRLFWKLTLLKIKTSMDDDALAKVQADLRNELESK